MDRMCAGNGCNDFAVLYPPKSLVTSTPVYLSSPFHPFTITNLESQAQHFGESYAESIAREYPLFDDLHERAKVVAVSKVDSIL